MGLLDGRTDWSSTLFAARPDATAHLLRIEAPDGTALSVAGTLGAERRFRRRAGRPLGTTHRRRSASPGRRASSSTSSDSPVRQRAGRDASRIVLDCDGGPSIGHRRRPGASARASSATPLRAAAAGRVGRPLFGHRRRAVACRCAGTFLGVAVRRDFAILLDGRDVRAGWKRCASRQPGAYVAIGDEYSARAGAAASAARRAERRVARRVLQRRRLRRGRAHRVLAARADVAWSSVVPFASAPVLGPPARDGAWVAGEVRQEIVRRLHGQDAGDDQSRALRRPSRRRGDALLTTRACAAGWDVPQRPRLEPGPRRRLHRHPPADGARAARRPHGLARGHRGRPPPRALRRALRHRGARRDARRGRRRDVPARTRTGAAGHRRGDAAARSTPTRLRRRRPPHVRARLRRRRERRHRRSRRDLCARLLADRYAPARAASTGPALRGGRHRSTVVTSCAAPSAACRIDRSYGACEPRSRRSLAAPARPPLTGSGSFVSIR